MANLRAILQNVQQHLGPMTDAELKKQLKALRQIELVSMQAKIPIQDVDLIKIFRAREDSNKIVTAPKEINKRLFDFQAANKAIIQRQSLEDLVKVEKRVMANAKKYLPTTKYNFQRNYDNAISAVKNIQARIVDYEKHVANPKTDDDDRKYYLQNIEQYKEQITQHEETAKAAQGSMDRISVYMQSDALIKDIAKVSLNGFWKFMGLTGLRLHFATVNDVILFEKNERSGLNIQKNMGRYLCELDLNGYMPRILPLARNFTVGGHIHPYVSSSKDVCFGNSGSYYYAAANAGNLIDCMNILATVISTYSTAGGPYVGLSSYLGEQANAKPSAFAAKYAKRENTPTVKRLDELMNQSVEKKKNDNGLAKVLGSSPRAIPRARPVPRVTVPLPTDGINSIEELRRALNAGSIYTPAPPPIPDRTLHDIISEMPEEPRWADEEGPIARLSDEEMDDDSGDEMMFFDDEDDSEEDV